jgi:hypothetical protein
MKIDTWFDIEYGYDFGYVEISIDNGATWSQLDDAGEAMTNYSAPNSIGHDSYAFTGQSVSWEHDVMFDLSDYAGISSVIIRFVYLTDPMQTGEGWVVDNIRLIDGDKVYFNGSDTSDSSWIAEGWELSDTSYDLEWTVYLIGYPYEGSPSQDDIYKMALNSKTQDGTISVPGLGSMYRHFVVVPSLIINNNNTCEFEYLHNGWIEKLDSSVPNTFPLYNSAQSKINDALESLRNSMEEAHNLNLDVAEFEKNMDKVDVLVEKSSFGANYVYRASQLNKALSILFELLSQL